MLPELVAQVGLERVVLAATTDPTDVCSPDAADADAVGAAMTAITPSADAITGETYEAKTMYPGFAHQAAKAGDRHAALLFSEIGRDERAHAHAFTAALHRL